MTTEAAVQRPTTEPKAGFSLLESDSLQKALFILPAMTILFFLLIIPICYGFYLSFFDSTMVSLATGDHSFQGGKNYMELLADGSFWGACAKLVIFAVSTTAIEVTLALSVAIYFDQVIRPPKFIESLIVVPMFVIPIVSGLTFRYMVDPSDGVVAYFFEAFGIEPFGILDSPTLSMVAIIAQDIWRMWPFVFLIIYAGLKATPKIALEAVKIDGANNFQAWTQILIPMLKPTIIVACVLKMIESLKAFTEIYVMTGGGPGEATELLPLYIVQQAFEFFRIGYGSAASTFIFLLGLLSTYGYLILVKKSQRLP